MTEIVWDRRQLYVYQQTEKSKFDVINQRYCDFLDILNDNSTEPVKVFDGLAKKQVEELALIREVSRTLQKKKDDDMMKQAAAAAESAETEAKEKPIDTELKEEEKEKIETKTA